MTTKKTWGGKRAGAGAPKIFKGEPGDLHVRVSGNTLKRMEEISVKKKMTLAEMVRKAIIDFWNLPE